MPIVVQCSACKKQFQAGDHLAGKQVKCPGCQTVLVLPGGQSAPAVNPHPMDELLSEEIPQRHAGAAGRAEIKCPGCGAPIREDAVLCVDCGYNFRTGRKIVPDTPSQRQARYEARDDERRGLAPGAKKQKRGEK